MCYVDKDSVTNATTGLMALRDVATYNDVPINIHVADHYIHVVVGFGTPYQKGMSWYLQDMYRYQAERDLIYKWIWDTVDELREQQGLPILER